MDKGIRDYIASKSNVMTFRIIKACKNCTYGRFEQEFEDLIIGYRNTYSSVSKEKDLNMGLENRNAHIKDEEVWDDEHPIFHHIHGKGTTKRDKLDDDIVDARFNEFMSYSPRNSLLTLDVAMTPTE